MAGMSRPAISIVVPAFNEARIIGETIRRIDRYFDDTGLSYEIVVVDDGSSDDTAAVVSGAIEASPRLRLISSARNQGKGAAVRTGVLDSSGEAVVFVDADLPYSMQSVGDAVALVQSGLTDVAIGSRSGGAGPLSLSRRVLAKSLSFFVTGFILRRVSDVQCGLKAFSREAASRLFGESRLDGASFDVEILYLADKYGYRIQPVPVEWKPAQPRRFVFYESWHLARDLIRVRVNDRKGHYRLPRRCPVCFSADVGSIAQFGGQVVRVCRRCRCRFFSGFASREEGDEAPVLDGVAGVRTTEIEPLDPAEERTCRRRTALLMRYLPPRARVLEIGAGSGKLGGILSQEFDYVGIDLSDRSCRAARARGVEVYRARLTSFVNTGSPFDAVAMFGVLEKMEDPQDALAKVSELLRPGGVVVIVTPDTESLLCTLSGGRWFAYETTDGAIFYSRSGLIELLERSGYEILSVGGDIEYSTHETLLDRVSRAGKAVRALTRVSLAVLPDPIPATFGRLRIVARRRAGRPGSLTPVRTVEPTHAR
jgi:dolichyl-phosphate beta-glucosyltransferase